MKTIRKAVFPVAGLGTRFLPATKASPKEMLAEVTCGEKILLLTEDQSTYIPLGEVHRLVNPGQVPLEIIEVQSGRI